ncbi:MAG: endonuclease/exonuclease/phosphatase family protein, partial [Lapillicoccus sp.]
LNGFVKQVLDADARANVVLAGDFNDYQFSGPVTTLTDNGATLTDLITTLPENERYTYNFNGISQVLDHIFVSRPLTDVQYDVVHINSEFSAQTSDHDPQVVRIRPVAASTAGAVTVRPKWQHAGRDVTVNLQGWGPKTLLTISLDGTTTLATYTTKQFGRGSLAVTIPASTPLGAHGIVVTAPDGSSASASINVSRACPAGMGPGIFALSTEGPVRPSPLEPAGELQAAAC